MYQAYFSLKEWITLKDEETLFLERVEDLVVQLNDQSKVIQVKNRNATITLNSSEILESISNYWRLRKKTSEKLKFIFLTTAQKGNEKSKPFDIKGLDYWASCKNGASLKPLRDFLSTKEELDSDLRVFLSSSSDAEMLQQLILPIELVTDEPSVDILRRAIERHLIDYGNRSGFRAEDSKRTISQLLEKVIEVICRESSDDRCLYHADFIEEFEKCLTVSISKSEAIRLYSRVNQEVDELMLQMNTASPRGEGSVAKYKIPDLEIHNKNLFIPRRSYIEAAGKILEKDSFLLITGSSGMGKSILSLQVAEVFGVSWKTECFRMQQANQIKHILTNVYEYLLVEDSDIILDDLNFETGYELYTDNLVRVINLLLAKNRKLIITSHKPLPSSIRLKLDLSEDISLSIGNFESNEIDLLLKKNSCPEKDLAMWRRDVEITTGSHPVLVHARVNRLKRNGWSKTDILSSEEIKTIKLEKSASILAELPSEDTRNLLLRLSILRRSFKRQNIFALIDFPFEIKTPELYLNQLIGPYLEQTSKESFYLTPLLEDAYKGNFSEDQISLMHEKAGSSYISEKLDAQDLSNIFHHGFKSGAPRLLAFGLHAFQCIGEVESQWIYPHLTWMTFISTNQDQHLYPKDYYINCFLRQAQFKIASHNQSANTIDIADRWFKEVNDSTIKTILPSHLNDPDVLPMIFYSNVFGCQTVIFPISRYLNWLISSYLFFQKNHQIFDLFKEKTKNETSWKVLVTQMALTKRVSISNLKEFFESIFSNENGLEILKIVNQDGILYRSIIDNIWIDKTNEEAPDWYSVISIFTEVNDLPALKESKNIRSVIFRAQAVIEKEYLENTERAKALIETALKQIGQHPEILNYQAKIAFLDKDHVAALEIWKKALPQLVKYDPGLLASFAYRDASVSASHLNEWKIAENYIKRAMTAARKQGENLFEIQCLAELGLIQWRKRLHSNSLQTFLKVIAAFPTLPDFRQDLRVLGLFKMVSNALLFFKRQTNNEFKDVRTEYVNPYPGVFSEVTFNPELKKLPIFPPESLITLVAEIEHDLEISSSTFKKLIDIYPRLPILYQAETRKIQVRRSLKSKNLRDTLKFIIDFFAITKICTGLNDCHNARIDVTLEQIKLTCSDSAPAISQIISFSLIVFMDEELFGQATIGELEANAAHIGLDASREWKDFIVSVRNNEQIDPLKIILDEKASVAVRVIAALRILRYEMNRDKVLYSCIFLALKIKTHSFFCDEMETAFCHLIMNKWLSISRSIYPYNQILCGDIIKLCEDPDDISLSKAIKIIFAASKISFINIDQVRDQLNALAAE